MGEAIQVSAARLLCYKKLYYYKLVNQLGSSDSS